MSANNYDVCPRCKLISDEERSQLAARAMKSYGKITAAEYDKINEDLRKPTDLPETLREDWEIGVSDKGEFYVNYRCECQQCGFEFSYKHEQQLDCSKPRKDS